MKFMYMNYQVNVTSFINRRGNTSYVLRFYRLKPISCDFYGVPAFRWTRSLEYTVIRYQWFGGSVYHLLADADGICYPAPCRMKELVPGFNWSQVKRALHTGNVPEYIFVDQGARYGK